MFLKHILLIYAIFSVMATWGIDVEVPEGLLGVVKTLINTNSSSQKEELALTTFLVLYIAICKSQ